MKVTFIIHSCYFVELTHCCLLFDYYQGDIPQTDKPLYVFHSHHHDDHFSPQVFQLARPDEVQGQKPDLIPPRAGGPLPALRRHLPPPGAGKSPGEHLVRLPQKTL